jgi:hypothetical protein
MNSQMDHPIPSLKLAKTSIPQFAETRVPQHQSRKLGYFLQTQIDQLATQSQIQWVGIVYQDPQMPNLRKILEASQEDFSLPNETLAYLQTGRGLVLDFTVFTLVPAVD